MRKRLLWLGTVLLACLSLFTFFSTKTQAAEKTYTIGTDITYAPFDFQDSNGHYTGIDIDLIKAIAKEEGFKVKLKPVGFNAAVQAVEANQMDGVIAGMTITNARKQQFDFSDPYYYAGEVMAVKQGSSIKSLEDLRGKKVALKVGTLGASYANSIKKKYGFTTTEFDQSNDMYNDVTSGNSAAAFEDYPVMAYGIRNGMKMKIVTKPKAGGSYGFAVKKGENQELLTKFNTGLSHLKKNGQYDKIVAKYLGKSAQAKEKKAATGNDGLLSLVKQNKSSLLSGLGQTLYLTFISIILATILGVIVGLMQVMPVKWVNWLSSIIIYIFRGMPLLVLALFIYIGVPNLTGSKISAFVAGIITLTLNEAAYTAAFVSGGIKAVDPGQMEAARSLGLPYGKAMRRVILPQGVKIMVPSFINQFIITLKDTSILSVIGILELTQTGKIIIARNLQGFKVWTIIAIMYIVIITLLTWLSKFVERRIND
ncbi:glutamine ABC transporter substrate-binding protein [Loigolactobacillus backii]|uniref:amino acid ABC transporter substrate-binding protein/permease n=1 Tax=Loigolactobacillus backii TaxID=375175 RepID=UPI0007F145D3|nr:amino acid ABC transporter substrate-binding protein/permease [Loigolactobacillus backii]ANK66664.1 glutamine ABC transporter substrate-binding protein [Loigolactobacillus backii]